jgi:hypothetical protein
LDKNDLAVIVPTLEATQMLRDTLASLSIQTFNKFDIIVVFDGVQKALPAWFRDEFPHTDVIFTGSNKGFAAAVNCGIRQSSHRLVFLLNDDARPDPDCLYNLMEGEKQYPEYGGFAARICFFYSPNLIESAGDSFSLAGRGFHRGWRQEYQAPYDNDEDVFGACGAAALYRRELLKETGVFEEDFFAIHEDVDLAFRAHRKGFRFKYLAKARVLHKGSVTIGVKSDTAVFYDSRNSELLLLKNVPLRGFLRMLPWYVLYTYHSVLCSLRAGYLLPYLRGKFAVLPCVLRMWQKGSLIELESKVPFYEVSRLFDSEWHKEGIKRALTDYRSILMAILVPAALLSLIYLIWR